MEPSGLESMGLDMTEQLTQGRSGLTGIKRTTALRGLCPLISLQAKVKVSQLCPTFCDPHGLYSPWNSPGQNMGVGSLSLLQGIFPTQGSNSGLPHCRQILYLLSHWGSPRILKWVVYPFSSGSSRSKNRTKVSCIAGRFFTC